MANLRYSPGHFRRHFDPRMYSDTYYHDLQPPETVFYLKAQHNFWSNFQRCSSNNGDEIRYLEYGGGPVVAYLISAAPKVDRIVFADFLEGNRRSVCSWIKGDNAQNWKHFIEYVVCDLEGERSAEGVHKREEELKNKMKSVVECDINRSPIITLEDFDVGKYFDVISTSMCLENCVGSEEQYKEVVVKLCQFLKPGGFIQMQGMLEENWYVFGNEKYYTFPSTKIIVEDAMKEADLVGVKIEVLEDEKAGMVSDHKFLYHAVGKKLL